MHGGFDAAQRISLGFGSGPKLSQHGRIGNHRLVTGHVVEGRDDGVGFPARHPAGVYASPTPASR